MPEGGAGGDGRWRRRTLTFGGYLLAWVLLAASFPALLAVAFLRDLVSDRRWPAVRMLVMALLYLTCELLGLAASGLLWIARVARPHRERWLAWHYRLQQAWAGTLFATARLLFGVRLEVEGDDAAPPGPLLVFMRHASIADTLLPAVTLAGPRGWRLRYVLKRELLWDPCLDVVGQRLPNVFVRRDGADSGREVRAVTALAAGLGVRDGVLVYPEGTRFTAAKRARRLAELAARGDGERLARAERLRHVLPPRTGGPLALLAAAPAADVLVVAHTGFEDVTTFADTMRGTLVGRVVRVRWWRHAAASVPREAAGAIEWLDRVWAEVDAWIDARRTEPEPR
jgi:1-acyl-sn-glycerol-3-phosphate acyltransferase